MALSAVGMYLLTGIGLHTSYAAHVLPATILLGFGLGLVFAPGFNLATLGVEARDSGVASAAVNTVQQIGGSIGTALLNTIAATAAAGYATAHLTQPAQLLAANAAVHSYVTTFWWAAGFFAVGAVLAALVLRPGVPEGAAEHGSVVL